MSPARRKELSGAHLARVLEAVRRKLGPSSSPSAYVRELEHVAYASGYEDVNGTKIARQQLRALELRKIVLASKKYGSMIRIAQPDADVWDIALSTRPNSYFSHGSAFFLHQLTDDVPTNLYVNREQSPKPPPSGDLTQAAIDRALSNKPRRSQYIFSIEEHKGDDQSVFGKKKTTITIEIDESSADVAAHNKDVKVLGTVTLLSGKNTGNLEVGMLAKPFGGRPVPTTNLERTLIDAAVRPDYAGGPAKVLQAYRTAVQRGVSANALVSTLNKLGHKYPFHQVIGFYLESAGAEGKILDRLRQNGIHFKFYIANGMGSERRLNERWQLYVPPGM